MSFANYRGATYQHVQELLQELRGSDLEALAERCRSLGTDTVRRYVSEHGSAMADYTGCTPSARKKALKKIPDEDRSLFVLGAAFHGRCALALLGAVVDHRIEPGLPYRSVTGEAAQAALELSRNWPTLWPWEDMDDPFDEA